MSSKKLMDGRGTRSTAQKQSSGIWCDRISHSCTLHTKPDRNAGPFPPSSDWNRSDLNEVRSSKNSLLSSLCCILYVPFSCIGSFDTTYFRVFARRSPTPFSSRHVRTKNENISCNVGDSFACGPNTAESPRQVAKKKRTRHLPK